MPFCLDVTDVAPEVVNFKSVLIVPCRFCPAASMAVRDNEPYIEFPRRFLKTASYERLINTMKNIFENRGIKTSVFKSNLPHQFVLCMWTTRRRKESDTPGKAGGLMSGAASKAVAPSINACAN